MKIDTGNDYPSDDGSKTASSQVNCLKFTNVEKMKDAEIVIRQRTDQSKGNDWLTCYKVLDIDPEKLEITVSVKSHFKFIDPDFDKFLNFDEIENLAVDLLSSMTELWRISLSPVDALSSQVIYSSRDKRYMFADWNSNLDFSLEEIREEGELDAVLFKLNEFVLQCTHSWLIKQQLSKNKNNEFVDGRTFKSQNPDLEFFFELLDKFSNDQSLTDKLSGFKQAIGETEYKSQRDRYIIGFGIKSLDSWNESNAEMTSNPLEQFNKNRNSLFWREDLFNEDVTISSFSVRNMTKNRTESSSSAFQLSTSIAAVPRNPERTHGSVIDEHRKADTTIYFSQYLGLSDTHDGGDHKETIYQKAETESRDMRDSVKTIKQQRPINGTSPPQLHSNLFNDLQDVNDSKIENDSVRYRSSEPMCLPSFKNNVLCVLSSNKVITNSKLSLVQSKDYSPNLYLNETFAQENSQHNISTHRQSKANDLVDTVHVFTEDKSGAYNSNNSQSHFLNNSLITVDKNTRLSLNKIGKSDLNLNTLIETLEDGDARIALENIGLKKQNDKDNEEELRFNEDHTLDKMYMKDVVTKSNESTFNKGDKINHQATTIETFQWESKHGDESFQKIEEMTLSKEHLDIQNFEEVDVNSQKSVNQISENPEEHLMESEKTIRTSKVSLNRLSLPLKIDSIRSRQSFKELSGQPNNDEFELPIVSLTTHNQGLTSDYSRLFESNFKKILPSEMAIQKVDNQTSDYSRLFESNFKKIMPSQMVVQRSDNQYDSFKKPDDHSSNKVLMEKINEDMTDECREESESQINKNGLSQSNHLIPDHQMLFNSKVDIYQSNMSIEHAEKDNPSIQEVSSNFNSEQIDKTSIAVTQETRTPVVSASSQNDKDPTPEMLNSCFDKNQNYDFSKIDQDGSGTVPLKTDLHEMKVFSSSSRKSIDLQDNAATGSSFKIRNFDLPLSLPKNPDHVKNVKASLNVISDRLKNKNSSFFLKPVFIDLDSPNTESVLQNTKSPQNVFPNISFKSPLSFNGSSVQTKPTLRPCSYDKPVPTSGFVRSITPDIKNIYTVKRSELTQLISKGVVRKVGSYITPVSQHVQSVLFTSNPVKTSPHEYHLSRHYY